MVDCGLEVAICHLYCCILSVDFSVSVVVSVTLNAVKDPRDMISRCD